MGKINKIVTALNTAMINLSKDILWDEEQIYYMQSFSYHNEGGQDDGARAFNTNIKELPDFELLFLNMKEYFEEMIRQERMQVTINSERLFQLNYLASIATMGSNFIDAAQLVGNISENMSRDPDAKAN